MRTLEERKKAARAASKKWRDANSEKHRAASRAWHAANAGRRRDRDRADYLADPAKANAAKMAWRRANPERANATITAWRLRKKEEAAGKPRPETCEVCDGPPTKLGLVFDHDHRSGAFRGWLCHHCNVALGHVRDSQWRLQALIDYLDVHEMLAVAA